MKQLICFLLVLLSFGAHADSSYDAWWQKANTLYQQKQYDSAAVYFEKLAALKPEEAVVYYNLGNTYYRLNRIGPAVLNYERALQLDPSDKKAKDNLSLAQSRISNRIQASPDIFFVQWWKWLVQGSKESTWAVLAILLFLGIIGLMLARRLGKLQAVPPQVTGIMWGVWLVLLLLSFFSAQHKADSKKAVVMQNDAPLLADPRQTKSQSLIPEGTTVKWKGEISGWVEVSLPDGRTGWMQQNLLAKI